MAGRKRHRNSRDGKRSTRSRADSHPASIREPDLFGTVRDALADPTPASMLSYVSMMLYAAEPPRAFPFADPAPSDGPRVSLGELASMFIDVPAPETSAVLAVIAELVVDEQLIRARVRRELATRPSLEPAWLGGLSEFTVHRAVRMRDALGDGDDVLLGVRVPGGGDFTCLVYLDHNIGSMVKDAFAVPEALDDVVVRLQSMSNDPDVQFEDIDLDDARACIEHGIHRAAITYPPIESETWPAVRPLIQWLIRRLPEGGSLAESREWTEEALTQLANGFFGSPDGNALDDRDHRELLDSILWYGTDYGSGDPLRWGPVRIEILLADWIPRKIVASAEYLAKAPDLLRAFIRFAHAEVGLRPASTDTALNAVDACEPFYQEVIRGPRPQGAAAVLDSLGVNPQDGYDTFDGERLSDVPVAQWGLDKLARQVGGPDLLTSLDDVPLPDEDFRWDGVPEDIVARVEEVLSLVDECCVVMLDVEYRTACRRLLARVSSRGPHVFRRNAKPEMSAAAVVWMIGRVNDVFNPYQKEFKVKTLMSYFGLNGSASTRAKAMLEAAEIDTDAYDLALGSPDYLVAARRRRIIVSHNRYRAMADGDVKNLDR